MKWFVGMPKNIFQGNPKRFSKKNFQKDFSKKFSKGIFQKDFSKRFFGNNKKNFQDNSRIKYIKQTKRDSIRYRLEKQAYFPQENESILQVFKKSFLHYFLPFPPEPPWKDPREKSNGSQS